MSTRAVTVLLAIGLGGCGGGAAPRSPAAPVAPTPTPTPTPLVQSFTGTTDVSPGITFRANRSQPPFTIDKEVPVTLKVAFSAPADCYLLIEVCPASNGGLQDCAFQAAAAGSAGSVSWGKNINAGAYQVVITLQTLPRSDNGPACQAFSGAIAFSGTATHP